MKKLLVKQSPNLMNLSRVSIRQKPVSIERRFISWNIKFNFKWNQPYLSPVSNLSRRSNSLNSASCLLYFNLEKRRYLLKIMVSRDLTLWIGYTLFKWRVTWIYDNSPFMSANNNFYPIKEICQGQYLYVG